jgi:hypothetical protein
VLVHFYVAFDQYDCKNTAAQLRQTRGERQIGFREKAYRSLETTDHLSAGLLVIGTLTHKIQSDAPRRIREDLHKYEDLIEKPAVSLRQPLHTIPVAAATHQKIKRTKEKQKSSLHSINDNTQHPRWTTLHEHIEEVLTGTDSQCARTTWAVVRVGAVPPRRATSEALSIAVRR